MPHVRIRWCMKRSHRDFNRQKNVRRRRLVKQVHTLWKHRHVSPVSLLSRHEYVHIQIANVHVIRTRNTREQSDLFVCVLETLEYSRASLAVESENLSTDDISNITMTLETQFRIIRQIHIFV